MLTKLKPEFRIQPFDTLPSMILILLRISYGGQGGLRQDRQTEYRDRKSAQPLAAGATSLIEQETSASILIKALAMTNSKIPMSNSPRKMGGTVNSEKTLCSDPTQIS